MKDACALCGFIHTSTDARRVGRFGGTPGYIAANADTPVRATREQAEADECRWRQRRGAARTLLFADDDAALFSAPLTAQPAPDAEPFPAANMEDAARAKAWCDFLSEVRMSLLVWEIDETVRANCEHVVAWIRRCQRELEALGGAA